MIIIVVLVLHLFLYKSSCNTNPSSRIHCTTMFGSFAAEYIKRLFVCLLITILLKIFKTRFSYPRVLGQFRIIDTIDQKHRWRPSIGFMLSFYHSSLEQFSTWFYQMFGLNRPNKISKIWKQLQRTSTFFTHFVQNSTLVCFVFCRLWTISNVKCKCKFHLKFHWSI